MSKLSLKYVLPLLILSLLALSLPASAQEPDQPEADREFPDPGVYEAVDRIAGLTRTWRFYIPESYPQAEEPVPLLIVLHTIGSTGDTIEAITGFNALADEEGFVVAYPDGVSGAWNDGRLDPSMRRVQDVDFIQNIISVLSEGLNIDSERVYVAGHSMGAMMALRMGCDLPEQVTAVAAVGATMPVFLLPRCNLTTKIPVLIMHGSEDPLVPAAGIENGYLSADRSIEYWVAHNECPETPDETETFDTDPEDGTSVERVTFSECAEGSAFTFYRVIGGGHTWPGRAFDAPIDFGVTSEEIDATQVVWDFLVQYRIADRTAESDGE